MTRFWARIYRCLPWVRFTQALLDFSIAMHDLQKEVDRMHVTLHLLNLRFPETRLDKMRSRIATGLNSSQPPPEIPPIAKIVRRNEPWEKLVDWDQLESKIESAEP
ncbi:MAG: hypothetical protein ACRD22_11980 [Terriglobia bacterium]